MNGKRMLHVLQRFFVCVLKTTLLFLMIRWVNWPVLLVSPGLTKWLSSAGV